MENQEKRPTQPESNDVELGVLMNLFIRICRKIFGFFAGIFEELAGWISWIVRFLRRNLIWIVLAALAGEIWGIYLDNKHGSKYESNMVVRTNFQSGHALYNIVDYLNALVSQGKFADLEKALGVSEKEARGLRYFDAQPVEDELLLTELYKQRFLAMDRSDLVRMDTFWSRTFKYEDFKKSLSKFDMPLHQISVMSIDPAIFSKIQNGLVNLITQNEVLKKNQELAMENRNDEEHILVSSIQGLDTLRRVYNQLLQQRSASKESGTTNLNFLDKELSIKTPELDLYDKILALKDELKRLRVVSAESQSVIQVYSPFSPVGKRMNLLKQDSSYYTGTMVMAAIVILLIIEIYRPERGRKKEQIK
ncbi:MAG: hypothetical protein ACHQET_01750 [Chitinophagales bacterium]